MKIFRHFFHDLKHSFYSPEFYKDIHKRTFSSGLLNIAIFNTIVSLVVVVVIYITIFPHATVSNIKEVIQNVYPNELIVTLSDGEVSLNIDGPYVIPLYDETLYAEEGLVNLLVIDTDEDVGIEDLERYKTIALLTKTKFIANTSTTEESEEIQIINLDKFKDMTISEETVLSFIDKMKPIYYTLLVLAPIFIIVFLTIAESVFYLFIALIGALAVLIVSKMRDLNYSYRDAYVVTLYAFLPVIFYDLLTDILSVGNLFSLGALVFLAILIINLKGSESESAD